MQLTPQQQFINNLLTVIQYAGFAIFILWSPWLAKGIVLLSIEFLGFGLAFWAIQSMRPSKINISPKPLEDAQLITSGPYHFIRHPMYTSILVATLPLAISHWDVYRFSFLMLLYLNLLAKMLFEESLLKSFFSDYKQYAAKTYRVIPFVF
jgi:protein-S-isoprenylcysteine O-methyltransferase Ste14